jgi:hypothetical protein
MCSIGVGSLVYGSGSGGGGAGVRGEADFPRSAKMHRIKACGGGGGGGGRAGGASREGTVVAATAEEEEGVDCSRAPGNVSAFNAVQCKLGEILKAAMDLRKATLERKGLAN